MLSANLLRGLWRDVLLFGGLATLGYGAHLAWEPAGAMVVGGCLLGIGVFGLPKWE